MDNGGSFYVHISYIFYSGELWVVYMSHIYNKHLPWTMVVHFTYTSPIYSTVVSSGLYICLTFITNTYHGQWWSILRTHLLHILQWWALGGLYVSHLLQTLQPSLVFGIDLPACKSEKSSPVLGRGTIPGSDKTALIWETVIKNTIKLKRITHTDPHNVFDIAGITRCHITT